MKTKTQFIGMLSGAIALLSYAPLLLADPKIDPDADRALRGACKYLADAKSFCVKVEVWRDLALPSGLTIQTARQIDLQQRRPGQLHIEVRSPRISKGFWLDGKSLTMLDRNLNFYGVMEVGETIDKAIDAVEDQFGIEIPLCDVLVADPYRNLMDSMETLSDLGPVTVLGTPCRHLVLTGPHADCQIWIAQGPRPLPKKIVVNLKADTGITQITQIFSDWDLVTPIADSAFTFDPPVGASKIVVNPKKADEPEPKPQAPAAAETPEKK